MQNKKNPCSLFISLLCLLFVGISMSAQAQNIESLLNAFNKQADAKNANQFFNELQKTEFLDEKIIFKQETPTDSLRQQVWYWAAEWFYDQHAYDEAERYGLKALPLIHPANDTRADCLNLMGLIYVRKGDFKQAADYAKQCLAVDMKSGDHDRISSSMNTVAGIYMAGYQAKEAEQYILQALEHAEKANNPARKAVLLGMASEIYHALGNDEKALPYAEQAYQIDSSLGRKQQAAIRLSQKASALLGLHCYKEAESTLREVIPALREAGDQHSMAIALNKLGMSLLSQKRQREAIPYYKEAAELFSKMGDLYNEIHSHRGLYESYWTLNPDSAKIELDRFDLLKDSLYTHATADALARYNAEFGNEQLQQENESERAAHRRSILIAAVLILLVAATAWYIVKKVQRRHRQHAQTLIREIEQLRKSISEKPTETSKQEDLPTEQAQIQEQTEEENVLPESPVSDDGRLFLMRVIDVVNTELPTGNYGVKQIAFELNMSESTFRRRLMETAGETPKSYISAIQMERAVTLLAEDPEMSIQKIATLCGFSETSSFTHAFKRVYACSPKQYREQLQGKP